jgi:hypothetical protein
MVEEHHQNTGGRKISKDKYILAGVLTALIFLLGLSLGFLFEDYRYKVVEEINSEQEVNYLSSQMQYLYLNTFRDYDNCPILSTTLKRAVVDLSESLEEVVTYEEEKNIASSRKESIQRRYLLDNLRYWLLAKESKTQCNLNIAPILYFYASDCPSCPNQGTILTYFKTLFGEQVLVFPINLDLREKEPMVEIVTLMYNVTRYPTLVIDDTKYEGVVKQEELYKVICTSLNRDSPQCANPDDR